MTTLNIASEEPQAFVFGTQNGDGAFTIKKIKVSLTSFKCALKTSHIWLRRDRMYSPCYSAIDIVGFDLYTSDLLLKKELPFQKLARIQSTCFSSWKKAFLPISSSLSSILPSFPPYSVTLCFLIKNQIYYSNVVYIAMLQGATYGMYRRPLRYASI